MRHKRASSWRGVEEAEEVQVISDEEEDANADLSIGILAKASHCSPLLSGLVVLSDDDDDLQQPNTQISESSSSTRFSPSGPEHILAPSAPKLLPSQHPHPGKKQKNRKKKKKNATATHVNQNQSVNGEGDVLFKLIADDGEDNLEMRKLLRGPRYFDPEHGIETCYRCGNTGHSAAKCTDEARKKACYVCGSLDHEARDCPQGSCFICKGTGHFAKSCPNKGIDNDRGRDRGNFCLRCGNGGHEMSFCDRDYDPGDLKDIQCYVCKGYGHLCCVDVALTSERQDTCYNCGEVGHTGVGCAKSRVHVEGDKRSGKVCYRCGEEGHFARGCSKRDEDDMWDDFRTPVSKAQQVESEFQGFRSVPAVVEERSRRQGTPFHDRRVSMPPVVRGPERWNMEEGDRWHGDRMENEHYRFMGAKYSDYREDHVNSNAWGRRIPNNKRHKHTGFHGHGEAGSSSGGGKRFQRKKRRGH